MLFLFVYYVFIETKQCYLKGINLNIKDVVLYRKYIYTKTNVVVEVLKVDAETKNVYVRNSKLMGGWYTQDGWTHVNNLSEVGE